MRAKAALLATASILATLTVAWAQQVPRDAERYRQYQLRQSSPAAPYYDDAMGYPRFPQWGAIPPERTPHRHKINPGGVGTDSRAQR